MKIQPPEKKIEIIDGYAIKYHANGLTRWSKGKMLAGKPEGYWEWYRLDGSIKRSGYFDKGVPTGEWITYNKAGEVYKKSLIKPPQNKSSDEKKNCPD